jgi:uncharacterized protein (TIGR03437 family)
LTEVAVSASIVTATVAIASTGTAAAGDLDFRVTTLDGARSVTFGGTGADIATRAVTAPDGAIYIIGNTASFDFPVTNASRARGGGLDGFLLKLDADLQTVYATYLGGAGKDDFQDLAVDASGSAFVAASSSSSELVPGSHGSGAYFGDAQGRLFEPASAESFRATVQAWLAPDGNTLFAATAGQGLFRSSDQGQTWTPLNPSLGDLNVTALGGDAQMLYAGTPRALYRSSNGGVSWSESATGVGGIRALVSSPLDSNIVYAAPRAGCGLYRSSDAGRTWQQLATNACIAALAAAGGSTLYAATSSGVAKSTDGGVTWVDLFRAPDVTAISVSNGRVWIGTAGQGVLVSEDGGATFARTDEAVIQQPVRSLLATPGFVAVGTDYLPDLYVAKVGPRGDQIVFQAFAGGLGSETSARVALDGEGNVYAAATTDSADLVATFEAVQRRFAGGASDVFLAKFSRDFDPLTLTYLGGSGMDAVGGIAVDARGFVHVTGTTASPDLAVSAEASRRDLAEGTTAPFLAVLSPNLGSLAHLTYANGSTGEAIGISGDNDIWIGGGGSTAEEGFVARFSGLVAFRPIAGVRNGASLAAGPIAPSSTVRIEGSGFGSSVLGLTVRIGTSEASVARASDTRIEVTAPPDLEPGSTVVVAVTSRTGLYQGSATVAAVSPGVFSADGSGTGVALASVLRVVESEKATTNTPVYECADEGVCVAVPVDLGDEEDQLTLLLRATGVRYGREIVVEMNGVQAEVVSAGALDSFSGVDRIAVKLPRSIAGPAGQVREVTIRVMVDGLAANPVTILIG